jgi:RNA polymerase sigma-70 factor (ECF subfamily)
VNLEELYRSHGHVVLRRARVLLGSEPDAQEALQELFAALLANPSALRSASSVVGYLYQATTHHCLNQLRNRRNVVRLLERGGKASDSAGPSGEALADLRRLLSRMPEDVAAAVVYHRLDGMTHDEVAGLLGCSRRQVGYLLERADQSLARAEQIA